MECLIVVPLVVGVLPVQGDADGCRAAATLTGEYTPNHNERRME